MPIHGARSGLAVIDEDDRLHLLETARLVELGRWNLPCKDVNSVAFTPDGRTLALGGADGQLVWWDVERQQLLGMNRWQARELRQLAFSPDGRSLAAAAEDGHVSCMDARLPRRFERLTPELAVGSALAFSPDGNLLAAAGPRRGVVLLDATTLQVRARIEEGSRTGLMAFLPTAASNHSPVLLTVGAADGTLALWDAAHGKLLRELPWHRGNPTRCLAVSPDGRRAAVGKEGGRVEVWDLAAGTYRSLEHGATVVCVAFSPDGLLLATAGENRLLKFWDLGAKPQEAPVAKNTLDFQALVLSFAPDNQHFLASTDRGGVHVWKRDRNSSLGDRAVLPQSDHVSHLLWSGDGQSLVGVGPGDPVRCWNFPARTLVWTTKDFSGPVTAAAWSSNGKQRLALSLADERAEIWNLETSEVRQPEGQGLAGPVHSLVFTPDGQYLVTASAIKARENRTHKLAGPLLPFETPGARDRRLLARTTDALRVWNVASGREQALAPLAEQSRLAPPSLAALAPDGTVLVCGSEDGGIGVWDRLSRRCKANLFVSEAAKNYAALMDFVPPAIGVSPRYPEGVRALTFCRSGRWLAALGTHGEVRVWETTNWTEHWTMPKAKGEVMWLAFAPDERLVICQEGKLHWWDVAERKLQRTLGGPGTAGVQCGAFAPDGRLLATTATDGRIHLWDLAAEKATPLLGHRDRVTALAFSPDGKTLASASWDQSVRLWVAVGREVAVLEGARGRLWSLAFSPDGNTLAAGGEGPDGSGDVVLWRADH